MSTPLPIACSLGAADFAGRLEELRALGADGLVSVAEQPDRAVLTFRPDVGIRRRVEAAAAAEAECCAFLDLRVEHREDATLLTISAPNGGAEVVHELADAFSRR
jgi:hypothetical protein